MVSDLSARKGGGVFKKNCTGMLKVDFRISTISYLEKLDFVTHQYNKLPQKSPNSEKNGCFFGQIFQNTPNFVNWAHWV